MQTVIYIYFPDTGIQGKAVVIAIPDEFHFIKGDVFIIELGNVGIYIQEVLVTVDPAIDIGIVKPSEVLGKEVEIRIDLPGGQHEAEFFLT